MNKAYRPSGCAAAICFLLLSFSAVAQNNVSIKSRIDARQITVGDQARLFIEATIFSKDVRIGWAAIPDSFNSLEIVEKGKIDTVAEGAHITYRQRLLVTGFDSGSFKVPAFAFTVRQPGVPPYILYSDSFQLEVSTLPVDTTKPFRPIKDIVPVKTTWRDYLWLIIGAAVFLLLAGFVIWYFIRHRRTVTPAAVPKAPQESLEERTLKELAALDEEQLWQQERVKEYYTRLTDILRNYIEERFGIPAREQTTDEILEQARRSRDMGAYYDALSKVLTTADLAKFAKAKPLPQEHTYCMQIAREFIINSKPVIIDTTTTAPQS